MSVTYLRYGQFTLNAEIYAYKVCTSIFLNDPVEGKSYTINSLLLDCVNPLLTRLQTKNNGK